jgi:hypothetical protein
MDTIAKSELILKVHYRPSYRPIKNNTGGPRYMR